MRDILLSNCQLPKITEADSQYATVDHNAAPLQTWALKNLAQGQQVVQVPDLFFLCKCHKLYAAAKTFHTTVTTKSFKG